MRLEILLSGVKCLKITADAEVDIAAVTANSGEATESCAFIAIRGGDDDGNNYINDALMKGAAVIITENELPASVPSVVVRNAREAMAVIAANFYGNYHKEMRIIGITGTNGKTTTAYMLNEILRFDGKKTAFFGTLGANITGEIIETGLTTPDPILFHKLIKDAYFAGVRYLIFEASAHAIALKKLAGIKADIAVFTNFSRDHLDFFKTLDEYAGVKKSYFTDDSARFAIINVDDKVGREIAAETSVLHTTFGTENPADIFAIDISENEKGSSFIVNYCDEIFGLKTNFRGKFNVYNALAAIAAARALSVDVNSIKRAFEEITAPDGRFNIINGKRRVIIDFAHTPDGLENLLNAARELTDGRVITVFGCGGNRDATKRPIMGEIAARLSDFTIITSDNSRFENPDDIMLAIEEGYKKYGSHYIKIVGRENAVTYAMLLAKSEDLVVIAGKGAENYMDENGIKIPYSDKKTVEDIMRRYRLQ